VNLPHAGALRAPALILAADHRARGVMTVERFADYVAALEAALPHADGILASAEPLATLQRVGALTARHRTYLSINRTGLAGSAFELDDRLVASVGRAAAEGWTGVKHMTRLDLSDRSTAAALELLGQVLEAAGDLGLDALIESAVWRDGAMARDPDSIVYAAVVAHDMGAPVLKVPVPDAASGAARRDAVARVVASVGVPILFLGGPRHSATSAGGGGGAPDTAAADEALGAEVRDVMAGGAAGLAIGRAVYQHPDPGAIAATLADIVHGR
jgi:DhnA family fructose-bisphosphate aldolase class Ia